MKKNTLTIDIGKSIDTVFRFTANPENTPKWIPAILEEKTSDKDVKTGTVYYQKIDNGSGTPGQSALVITRFVKNKRLDFRLVGGAYTCSYRYEEIPAGTRLTYSEENGINGEIKSPMTMENLQALKKLIEEF